ncbi:uncharacterized protein LOC122242354 isoform X1 [Penaeus japonicus]|uniref:uncharacterized protein LOC122242354 isoform X1 n=1 Tax=Penaeus japonicus TaxID=27405 RepID=UPI001C710232|nr:uncharacterized protein LOC122242354 isoform X1 [Penaeus japonicus]
MNSSVSIPSTVVLLKQRRLLQAENMSLEGLVAMKSRRLSLVAEENLRLKALLRDRGPPEAAAPPAGGEHESGGAGGHEVSPTLARRGGEPQTQGSPQRPHETSILHIARTATADS